MSRSHVEAQIRKGVVKGAKAVECEVCGTPSEGWAVTDGKLTYYHFKRVANCVRRTSNIPTGLPGV
jgi:hypothetical protein